MAYISKKDFKRAEETTDKALQYTNQTAYYMAKKGAIKNKLNQKDSAQYYFNLSLDRYYKKEQNIGIKNQIISILYQMGNKEGSLKVLNECLNEYPKDSIALKAIREMLINDDIPR
ncbi:MAG: hypothetical protein HRT66_03600 [Flavobacteriaceae bacterium]|nr:hypothetical protein [Flavobacteriaceae bacterium]